MTFNENGNIYILDNKTLQVKTWWNIDGIKIREAHIFNEFVIIVSTSGTVIFQKFGQLSNWQVLVETFRRLGKVNFERLLKTKLGNELETCRFYLTLLGNEDSDADYKTILSIIRNMMDLDNGENIAFPLSENEHLLSKSLPLISEKIKSVQTKNQSNYSDPNLEMIEETGSKACEQINDNEDSDDESFAIEDVHDGDTTDAKDSIIVNSTENKTDILIELVECGQNILDAETENETREISKFSKVLGKLLFHHSHEADKNGSHEILVNLTSSQKLILRKCFNIIFSDELFCEICFNPLENILQDLYVQHTSSYSLEQMVKMFEQKSIDQVQGCKWK